MFKSKPNPRRFVGLPLIIIIASLSLIYSSSAWLQSSTKDEAGPYDDVSASSDHVDSIARLKDLGVITGTECDDDDNFCPDDPIDRKTLAVWLIRVLQGDDAPDFVGEGNGFIDFSSVLENPDLLAMLTPEQIAALTPRFEDVPLDHPQYNFIEQMAELEISGGCSKEPAKFCPDKKVSRSHMAAFFARAFDLETPNYPARFIDVDKDGSSHKNISRLTATTIDPGCGYPSRFCPSESVSRAQMADLLARAIDWQKAKDEVVVTGSDDSIRLTVTYDDKEYEATVRWKKPSSSKGRVDHYILQSRTILEDFGPGSYQIVESKSGKTSYRVDVSNSTNTNYLYAFKVIVVYANGKRLATSEVKNPSKVHKLRDIIWSKVVEPKQKEQPWLTDTWIHMNDSNRFGVGFGSPGVAMNSEHPHPNGLKRLFAKSLTVGSPILQDQRTNNMATLLEEMGHVYTLTNQVDKSSAPIAIGHLYIHLLEVNHKSEAKKPHRCKSSELYGDLSQLVFWERYSDFDVARGLKNLKSDGVSMSEWTSCGFRLDLSIKSAVDQDIPAIARSVFVDQEMPQWFYNTYQKSDGAINLEKLWSDITIDRRYKRTMALIVHHLRNEFGGYCSEEQVRLFIEGDATGITNPWKDGGCTDVVVVEDKEKTTPSSSAGGQNQAPDVVEFIRNGNTYGSYLLVFLQRLRNTPERCWIAINGYVYDVTPGEEGYNYPGPGSITDLCGKDSSEHFSSNNLGYPPIRYLRGGLRS